VAAAPHTPALAAGEPAGPPRRSLLLAGGGMRVAYQAGVMVALQDAGLTFAHADGTSGGTMNLAMLLSGVTPAQACERWRTLDVRGFVSLPPLRRLLRGPPYPALGSSDGIRERVYPHLGIDPERIRAARGIQGTFNVCDYTRKVNVAVAHQDVDLDLLVAGVSLPVLSPAVHHAGVAYVDSVWIKDVNVGEAVRRGAEELWLVWAIGNHGVYRDGAFQQYVHMIEMSANGALFEELAAVARANETRADPIRLHVVRPRQPLPLDPDFFFGRVDAATLVAMGHRDACEYLDRPRPDGVALGPEATRMDDPRPGIGFRETLSGDVGGRLTAHVAWEVDDLDAFAQRPAGTIVGDLSHPAIGERRLARGGEFSRDGEAWGAQLRFANARLELRRERRAWREVEARLVDDRGDSIGEGRLRAHAPPWRTLHARGVGSLGAGARAVARFARLALTS
jgi:predicted patatin/cPLA2 family phospholipase